MGSERNYVPAEMLVGVMDQVIDRHDRRAPQDKEPTPGITGGQAAWTGNDNPDHTELPGLDDGDRQVGEHTYVTQRHEAAVPPTVTDDAPNFAIGDLWQDTNLGEMYVCLDATAAAAVWGKVLVNPVNNAVFVVSPTGARVEGDVRWNPDDHTLDLQTDTGTIIQVGLEQLIIVYNDTGVLIPDGSALIINGATPTRPTVTLAKADLIDTTRGTIGFATADIPIASEGKAATFGMVRDIDTSACTPGNPLFLSATTAGGFTDVPPIYPNYRIDLGTCLVTDALVGTLHCNVIGRVEDIIDNGWNGNFLEQFDFRITSAAGVITGALERTGTGDLTMNFSTGMEVLDTTPAVTIVLTGGLTSTLQSNYVYIPIATKVLTVSLTGWPATEHIKVAEVELQSAADTLAYGAMKNRNVNNYIAGVDKIGLIEEMCQRLRIEPARWNKDDPSGCLGTLTINTGPTPDDVFVDVTAGTVFQLHLQSFPALDMATGDDIHVINHPTAAYTTTTNLNTQILDATGAALSNRSFSFVVIGIQNKTGEMSHITLNLPTGSYPKNSPDQAVNDALNYSVYDIPDEFQGVGFLIARFTLVLQASGNDWSLYDYQDLRGKTPNTTAGGGGGGTGVTSFLQLSDTPAAYTGEGGKVAAVNVGETALEFIDALADPMTTRGDMIIRDALNVTARLAAGAAGYLLTSDGTDIAFAAPPDYKPGGTDVAIADGGTGHSTAPGAGALLIGKNDSTYAVAAIINAINSGYTLDVGDGTITANKVAAVADGASAGIPIFSASHFTADTGVISAVRDIPMAADTNAFADSTTQLVFVVPASMNGMNLTDVMFGTVRLSDDATGGTTDINLNRRRAGSVTTDLLSTAVTLAYDAYSVNDGVVNGAKDDIETGDILTVIITNNLTGGFTFAATGPMVTLTFETP